METAAIQSAPQFSVVVDTSSFARRRTQGDPHQDAYLEGADVQLLFGGALPVGHTLYVPEIVVLEMIKHFREDLQAAIHDVDRYLRRAGEVLRLDVGTPAMLLDADTAVVGYEQWLRQHLVQDRHCTILPIPNAARDGLQLIHRDLAGRRPFSEGGRGMRDTVLWLSVLELLGSSIPNVALITANTKDFCPDSKSAGQLHDHLHADLEKRGWSGRVEHFPSIGAFAEVHIKPMTQQLEAMRYALSQYAWEDFDLRAWLQEAALPVLQRLDLPVPGVLGPTRADIKSVKIETVQVKSVYRVSSDAFYLEGSATLLATAHIYGRSSVLAEQSAAAAHRQALTVSPVHFDTFEYQLIRVDGDLGASVAATLGGTIDFSLVLGPQNSITGALIEVVNTR